MNKVESVTFPLPLHAGHTHMHGFDVYYPTYFCGSFICLGHSNVRVFVLLLNRGECFGVL